MQRKWPESSVAPVPGQTVPWWHNRSSLIGLGRVGGWLPTGSNPCSGEQPPHTQLLQATRGCRQGCLGPGLWEESSDHGQVAPSQPFPFPCSYPSQKVLPSHPQRPQSVLPEFGKGADMRGRVPCGNWYLLYIFPVPGTVLKLFYCINSLHLYPNSVE